MLKTCSLSKTTFHPQGFFIQADQIWLILWDEFAKIQPLHMERNSYSIQHGNLSEDFFIAVSHFAMPTPQTNKISHFSTILMTIFFHYPEFLNMLNTSKIIFFTKTIGSLHRPFCPFTLWAWPQYVIFWIVEHIAFYLWMSWIYCCPSRGFWTSGSLCQQSQSQVKITHLWLISKVRAW